jgi:signal transduction histidine kinase
MEEKEEMKTEELRRMLSIKTEEQIKNCTKELHETINKILDKHKCMLDISITLRQGSIVPNIGVIPRVPQQNGTE